MLELLIIVIITGVLAAMAIPAIFRLIGKAREAEAKTNLGTLASFQEMYHFEHGYFYKGNISNFAEIKLVEKHYAYTADRTANRDKAIHLAYAIDPNSSKARDLSMGLYFNGSTYSRTLCVADNVDKDGTSSSVTALEDGTCAQVDTSAPNQPPGYP